MTKRRYEYAGDEERLGNTPLLKTRDGMQLLIRDAGTLVKISGLLIQGMGNSMLWLYPSADEIVGMPFHEPTLEEWTAFLKRSDDPLIFEQDETGTLKAVVRKAQYAISGAVQQKIWVRDGCRCMLCGKKMGDVQLTIDHFVPLQRGGANNQSNYLSACRLCQKRKGSMDPEVYCAQNRLDYDGLVKYLEGKMPAFLISHLQGD